MSEYATVGLLRKYKIDNNIILSLYEDKIGIEVRNSHPSINTFITIGELYLRGGNGSLMHKRSVNGQLCPLKSYLLEVLNASADIRDHTVFFDEKFGEEISFKDIYELIDNYFVTEIYKCGIRRGKWVWLYGYSNNERRSIGYNY